MSEDIKGIVATDKPFGFKGELIPASAFQGIRENILYNKSVIVSIHDNLIEVGYDNEVDKERAQKIAHDFITSWSFRNNIKIESPLNMSWRPSENGARNIQLQLQETIKTHDRVTTTITTKGMAYVVKQHDDSYSFKNDTVVVRKAENDQVLSLVLKYFYEEVLSSKRPKVGIYRIVEELEKKLGKRKGLAHLVGQGEEYVSEIMQSVQEHRHALAWLNVRRVTVKLSDQECIDRTKRLIEAYANSLN